MSDEIKAEVAMNPATGALEAFAPDAVPQSPQAPVSAPPLVRGVPLRFLDFEGEKSTPETCEAAIKMDSGRVCNVDLMSEAELAELETLQGEAVFTFIEKMMSVKIKGFDNMKLQGDHKLNIAARARVFTLLIGKSKYGSCETDFQDAENFSSGS